MDESTLLYQEGEPDVDGNSQQVVLQLPEGCDATEGVIMQIEGDKIHIITQGGQLGGTPLGLSMESIIQVQQHQEQQARQLCLPDAGEAAAAQLQVTDDEQEVMEVLDGQLDGQQEEEQAEEVGEETAGQQLPTDHAQLEMQDSEPAVACFVCSDACHQPARLLLARAAGSGVSLAERLASLLPLRLHCSAEDGVCSGCRQLIEQADLRHTQLKAVELQVRQLFRLEERLEEEERRQEQEQEAARQRQETLARRQEQERRRQREHDRDQERRQKRIRRRLRAAGAAAQGREKAAEPFPFEADDDFNSGGEAAAAGTEAPPAPPPPPPPPPQPPADDVTDEDWTPRKKYTSRRRRQPRRPWSPSDYGDDRQKNEAQGTDARDTAAAASEQPPSQTDQPQPQQEAGKAEPPTDAAAAASDQDQQVQEQEQDQGQDQDLEQQGQDQQNEDQTADGTNLDDVPTTTIEFVSFNHPRQRGGSNRLISRLSGSGRGRKRSLHSAAPNFYCRRCDTTFDCSSALVAHITTTHTRPWCRRCRREFDSGSELLQHRRRCRSQCALCGARPANLALHLRSKHPHSAPEAGERKRGGGRAAEGEAAAGSSRPRPRGSTAPAAPKMIEFRDVSALREQVKNVKTPRFNIKFRRASMSDLARIQHLSVDDSGQLAAAAAAAAGAEAGAEAEAGAAGMSSRPVTNRPHTCLRCGQHLSSLKEQIEHLHTVHKGKSWCRRCKSEFPNKQANLDHKPECRRVNAEGACPQCGKHVKNLKVHLRTHDTPGKRKRESVIGPDGRLVSASLAGGECHICQKFISHRLKRHIASHVQHPCPICKKVFSREDVIAGHIKRVHMKERPHICNHCGKGFVSLYSMQRHEMIHTNSYRFYCQECGDGFRQKQQLTTHMRHKHGVVEIEFEDVRESTILGETILEDDGTVTTELRFYCQECGSGFHTRRQLTAHMRHKHGVANVVFEDVQLHVAGTIEHLQAVTVEEEGVEVDGAVGDNPLSEHEQGGDPGDPGDPATGGDDRQDWWNPDQTAAY